MSQMHALTATFVESACGECGIVFFVPDWWQKERRNDHKSWYCPNGHCRVFKAESEAEQLRKQLDQEKKRREWAETRRDEYERSNVALRGQVTKAKNEAKRVAVRVGNGVCPCCNRSFTNLRRHMKTKHPEHGKADA